MSKTALVIIDLQKAFMNEYTKDLPRKIRKFMKTEDCDFDYIITTRYLNHENTACYQFENWKECMYDDPNSELVDEIKELNLLNVDKDKYSCYNTDFKNLIHGLDIKDIYLCGVNTGCCVLHSAFDMYDDLLSVYVYQDLCASTSGPESHAAAIKILEECITKQRVVFADPDNYMIDTSSLCMKPENEDLYQFHIEATMKKRWANDFCSMLHHMEVCGDVGHSAMIGFYADGDGDFRPTFRFDKPYERTKGYKPSTESENFKGVEIIFDAD